MGSSKPGNVVELFAGVGGFRLGLEGLPDSQNHAKHWQVVWSNQWEPTTKRQDASACYTARFGPEGHSSIDIQQALDQLLDKRTTPEAASVPRLPRNIDLLVGGFPCQDYSVAKSLSQSNGITGQKGVLWWQIRRFLMRRDAHQPSERSIGRPRYVLLENVDRLLKSPASQRGRDFAIMLATLHLDGYDAHWRVIDASEYGFPQRRKRVFIVAERRTRPRQIDSSSALAAIIETSTLARAFPVRPNPQGFRHVTEFNGALSPADIVSISKSFGDGAKRSVFENAGIMRNGLVFTARVEPRVQISKRERLTLGNILLDPEDVPDEYYIRKSQIPGWQALKGAKKIERVSRRLGGEHTYTYSEGAVTFPDDLSKPSRTILTGEGGTSPSRFKHVIDTGLDHPDRALRRLTPIELERLQGFPDDWTRFREDGSEISPSRRAFFMGNALVVGIVARIGEQLAADRERGWSTI